MLPPQQMDDQDTCFCWACDVSFLQLFIHHLETFRENVLCLGWPNAGESKNVQYPNFVGLYPHYIIYLHPNDIAISRDMILPSSPFRLWVNLGLFAHCSNPPKSYQVWKLFNICSLLEWPLNPCANPPENLGPNSQELERGTRTQVISFHWGLGQVRGGHCPGSGLWWSPEQYQHPSGGCFNHQLTQQTWKLSQQNQQTYTCKKSIEEYNQ